MSQHPLHPGIFRAVRVKLLMPRVNFKTTSFFQIYHVTGSKLNKLAESKMFSDDGKKIDGAVVYWKE